MSELKRVIQMDADLAVLNFNFVEGHVYRDEDGYYNVPAAHGVQSWAVDCWKISGSDWDAGVRPVDLEAAGQLPVPVLARDLGKSVGWLDELENKKNKRLKL